MNLRRIFDINQPTKEIGVTHETSDAPRFLSRRASSEQRTRHYIETRWHDQYQYYVAKAEHNRHQHQRLQLFIAVVAVLVPVLLGFNGNLINWVNQLSQTQGVYSNFLNLNTVGYWISFLNAIPAILSGLVAAATALENVQKYGDNYRAFQTAADGLERERALFEANSGPYRNNPNNHRLFVERSEDVIAQETGRYFAREEVKGADDPEADPEDIFNELMSADDINTTVPMYDDTDIAQENAYG